MPLQVGHQFAVMHGVLFAVGIKQVGLGVMHREAFYVGGLGLSMLEQHGRLYLSIMDMRILTSPERQAYRDLSSKKASLIRIGCIFFAKR